MNKEVRELVWQRSKGLCEYCGNWLDEETWDFHHRLMKSHGGKDSVENGVALHHFCHTIKIHNHPRLSFQNGFIVPSYGDPYTTPIHLYNEIEGVFLEKDGTYRFTNLNTSLPAITL